MILVDTSVWIDHFRRADPNLTLLLEAEEVMVHPFVIGELACGNLRARSQILGYMSDLPGAKVASFAEVLVLLEKRKLHGQGLGYVDAHLLASSILGETRLWTHDRALLAVARKLKRAYLTD